MLSAPSKSAVKTVTVAAMQWSKLPSPTRNASDQITAMRPVAVSHPSTSQAISASRKPVATALENWLPKSPSVYAEPYLMSWSFTVWSSASDQIASPAKMNAPTRFITSTITQRRMLRLRYSQRRRVSITGYSVFSVKNWERPMITAM